MYIIGHFTSRSYKDYFFSEKCFQCLLLCLSLRPNFQVCCILYLNDWLFLSDRTSLLTEGPDSCWACCGHQILPAASLRPHCQFTFHCSVLLFPAQSCLINLLLTFLIIVVFISHNNILIVEEHVSSLCV